MKKYQRGLLAAMFALNAFAAASASAEIVTIPFSAALPRYIDGETCIDQTTSMVASDEQCILKFPLTIPMGHTIQQIFVSYGTDSLYPGGGPYISAMLATVDLTVHSEDLDFMWSSTSSVPDGTIVSHKLMAQVGKTYPDQFAVASNTTYQVLVQFEHGVIVYGVSVVYN